VLEILAITLPIFLLIGKQYGQGEVSAAGLMVSTLASFTSLATR